VRDILQRPPQLGAGVAKRFTEVELVTHENGKVGRAFYEATQARRACLEKVKFCR
jgi:hypothetical protein